MTKLHSCSFRKPLFRISPRFRPFTVTRYRNGKFVKFEIKIIQSKTFPPDKREHLTGKRLSLWPEKRIGMAGKIGYFLFALLVLTTGTLCRQQLPVQYASGGDSVGSLTQHVPPQEKSGLHYFHHSFIASETVSEVIAPMLHINCRQLASATPSLRPSEKVRSLAAIVRRIPIPTRWITTSFRWANPDLTASIAPMRIFRPKRRTTLV